MQKITSVIKNNLTVTVCILMITGVFFASYPSPPISSENNPLPGESISWPHAPFILSVSMIVFFILPFLFNKPATVFANFFQHKELLALTLVFFCLLLGFLNSTHYSYIFQRLQIKLPFLILPFAAATLSLTKKEFLLILRIFLLCTFLVAFYMFINYLLHFDRINASYLMSKVMPTPMNHIRFSLLAALSVYSAYHLLQNREFLFPGEKALISAAGVFLFLFIHIYSVRSGLIALYGILFSEIILYILKHKSYLKGIAVFIVLLLTGYTIFSLSPSLKNKLLNTRNDISIYQNNGYANYSSLTTRFISYEVGFELFRENIMLGCGLGDLEIKNAALFRDRHPEISTPIIPHNQFIYYLAGMGLTGFVTFCVFFFMPLFYKKNYRKEFLLITYIVLFLSFLTEPMIETQLGVACTLLFIVFPLMVKEKDKVSVPSPEL